MKNLPPHYQLSRSVAAALKNGSPLVALESTVITHGLPRPHNLELAWAMEKEISTLNAVPATMAFMDGKIKAGLNPAEVERLAAAAGAHKISTRDIAVALVNQWTGGTTVAATMFTAQQIGIKIFATGGIGGVHRGNPNDVSADLEALASIPIVVVCAGAKAILDLPATREKLETLGIPVIGFQTDEFPAFYSASSGLPVDYNARRPEEIARIAKTHWQMGLKSAILAVNPPPAEAALPREMIEEGVLRALESAEREGISGSAVTPYLLARMKDLTEGRSLETNLALLKSNARLAAQIAQFLYSDPRLRKI